MRDSIDGANSLPLPHPTLVQSALRTTTERLAAELGAPRPAPPDWSPFEWRAARAVAAMHGISGLLAERLHWQGPPGWQEFLLTQRAHIARRHLRIQHFISLVDRDLSSRDIPGLALKGAALYAEGIYAPGDRPMGDVDLLVYARHCEAAAQTLAALGLRQSYQTFKHRVFVAQQRTAPGPFGEHADNDINVDLHERVVEALPLRLADISPWVFPTDMRPGLNPYPSRAALLAHLLLHAAGAMVDHSLRLVQLHDIALLGTRCTAADWGGLLEWQPWWALPPLTLAERYYGRVAPRAVVEALRSRCPPILRRGSAQQRVSDVSLSHLWVSAFPGLEWARSPGEFLGYVARRVVPGAAMLADRRFALQTEPSLGEGDWGGLSQGRRIMRALKGHVPRPAPLYNLRWALGQRH